MTVHARADRIVEADENLFVRLLNPSGVQMADRDGVGTIVDDDRPPPTLGAGDPVPTG